jgi:hypothetical protein
MKTTFDFPALGIEMFNPFGLPVEYLSFVVHPVVRTRANMISKNAFAVVNDLEVVVWFGIGFMSEVKLTSNSTIVEGFLSQKSLSCLF